ncbi:MAG: YfiR family protein [Zoogloeaceae bacterium]|nr:YfiR family protein [Zoogloeaceae bacterium]
MRAAIATIARLLLVALAPAGICASALGAPPVDERTLRAVMVYNLMAFTDWPGARKPPEAPNLRLCVLTRDEELMRAFAGLSSRPIAGRVLLIEQPSPEGSLDHCNTVYIDHNETPQAAWFAGLHAAATLTITARPVGGEIISLELVGKRLVFDVSLPSLRESRLHLSARVLELARKVWR